MTTSYLRAEFSNGKEFIKPFYETEYGCAFNLLPRSSCSSCRCKGGHHVSDITIGDFWGCTEQDFFWNPHGVSVIFVHTENGMNLVSSEGGLNLTEAVCEQAVEKNPMYLTSRCRDDKQKQFTTDFAEGVLFYACDKSVGGIEKTFRIVEKSFAGMCKEGNFVVTKIY